MTPAGSRYACTTTRTRAASLNPNKMNRASDSETHPRRRPSGASLQPPRQHGRVNFQRLGDGLHLDARYLMELHRLALELERSALHCLRAMGRAIAHLR